MSVYRHPQFSRRIAVQAGAVGLLGLGMNHHQSLQAADVKAFNSLPGFGKAKSLIYIFLLSAALAFHGLKCRYLFLLWFVVTVKWNKCPP